MTFLFYLVQCFKTFLLKNKYSLYSLVQSFKTFHSTHVHTKIFAFEFTIFTSCTSTPLYIPTHSLSCHPVSNTHDQKRCHLPSIFWQHLPNSNFAISYIPNLYKLATTKEGGLHFILSDNGNYNFYVKIRRCGFVDLLNDVIDYGCLECVFCFRIKEKEKDIFYINFYSIIFIIFFFWVLYLITSME